IARDGARRAVRRDWSTSAAYATTAWKSASRRSLGIGHRYLLKHLLVHTGNCGVGDTPFPGDSPGTFARCEAITRELLLMVCQLGLSAHVHTALAGCVSALVSPLYNPMPLVLCHG